MARKDDLIKTFLSHDKLRDKYNITEGEVSLSMNSALQSDKPIVCAIARIVNELEDNPSISDAKLYEKVILYLNTATL